MKKYLLAVDGSDNSRRAAHYALNLLRENSSLEITLIHVVNFRKELVNYSPIMDIRDIEREVMEGGREIVEQQALIFENDGYRVEKMVEEGDPGFKVAQYAKEGGFDQIILGTRGLSDFKGLVLGSISHKVLHFAQCPVTLVK
ncbi:MAG: universal stress protein UspA [Peptococcaceae bacterium BICA1-7]|jgi:nucleotide-binding universal stress UspA family protein|nr:MAG: universal stress protein UspA [Peptococcaceae bacterium BICA1-7]HBV98229.1 universal stress protein [Desulfotomaculum sp.]